MSFIIDSTDNFFFNLPSKHSWKFQLFNKRNVFPESKEYRQFEDILCGLDREENQLIGVSHKQNFIVVRFYLFRVHRKLSAILKLKLNLKTQHVTFSLKLLNQDNKYLRVEGKERIQLMCKYLNSRFFQNNCSEFSLVINNKTGEVLIRVPLFYFLAYYESQKLIERLIKTIKYSLNNSLGGFFQTLQMILDISSETSVSGLEGQKMQMPKENFSKYYKYSRIVNMFMYICSQSTHQEQFLLTQIQRQLNSMETLKQKYVVLNEFYSLKLYRNCRAIDFAKEESAQLQIDSIQKQKIKSRIEMPSMQKSNNPTENCYILNYIKTRSKLTKCLIKKICSGGFTSIYLASVQFWYVSSYNLGTAIQLEGLQSQDPHKKYIVIKREDKRQIQQGKKSRIAHERFILTRIKNGVSMFLNKYYLLAEKDNDFENDLLSDYIDYPNLYQYCVRNRETISFQTKIYLSIMIAQSLRYLAEYNIAHLDLKPSNIMTNRKLTIKLIDFGESYHPELKNHQPGFSMPYSAPEIFKLPDTYNYKNDVFSLGVIMHEMFLGKYPFYFNSDSLRDEVYRRQSFSDYWFHCSEGNAIYGESVVFPLIESLIVRCLNPDPSHRPELQWIVYIMRGCLDFFY